MAVRDDLDPFGEAHELTHFGRAPALQNAIERQVDRPGDVTLPRVAVGSGETLELRLRPDVEKNATSLAEAATELVQGYVCH